MGLIDYANDLESGRARRRRCQTCALPDDVIKEVVMGRERAPKPVPFPMISKWLVDEHGIKIQPNTIRNHFVAGHHND